MTIKSRIVMPLVVALVLFAIGVALLAVPGAWLFVALFLTVLPAAAEVAIATIIATALVALFWWRDRTAGIAMTCGLIAVAMLIGAPTLADSPAHRVAELAQVAYYSGDLRSQEAELRRKGVSPAVAVKLLDGFISVAWGLALDPSGEITLPPGKRSAAWQATAGQTEIGINTLQARHVIGDYYAWSHN
jgi:hypothetical protein